MAENGQIDLFNLDFSILGDSAEKVDTEQLKQKIFGSISSVLSSIFISGQKTNIITLPNRLNFACPYCGDSRRNSRKKRGNLYLENLHYKCYNTGCGSDSVSLSKFLADFNLEGDYTFSEISYIRSRKGSDMHFGGSATSRFTSYLNKLDEYAVNRTYIMSLLGAVDISKSKRGMEYLKIRKQLGVNPDLFGFDDKKNNLYFFNLSSSGDKVIGCQIRHLNARKNEQRFTTYNYSKLITDFVKIEDPDPDIMALMDKYGLIYNILRVNMGSKVYILEGPIDSNHIKNSVATMSASTKVYFSNGYYIYDNSIVDAAGRSSSIKMLKEGQNVYAWKKFAKDYPQFGQLKDVNDIMRKDENFPINDVKDNYFINNELDMIYV
jgi:hypothetical protein